MYINLVLVNECAFVPAHVALQHKSVCTWYVGILRSSCQIAYDTAVRSCVINISFIQVSQYAGYNSNVSAHKHVHIAVACCR